MHPPNETGKGPESREAQHHGSRDHEPSVGVQLLIVNLRDRETQLLLRLWPRGHQEQLWATNIFLGPSAERVLVAAPQTTHPPSFSQLLWVLTKLQAMAR